MPRSMRIADRLRGEFAHAWCMAKQTARLAIGLPDYDAYRLHVRDRHPEATPMTREEFAVARMEARYGRGTSRCC